MKNLAKHLGDPRKTSPREPIPGYENQMKVGPAGGYVFQAGDWERLDRFLIIGTEGGTYYVGERGLTLENAAVVRRCLVADMPRTLARIIEVSDQGLAPKNDPAILALALAFCEKGIHVPLRDLALQKVCRTGTHLFQFLEAVRGMRGGGRGLNRAVRSWLDGKDIDRLALQMVKYRVRAGWTWRDVLRRYRPKPPAEDQDAAEARIRRALYAWAAGKEHAVDDLPTIVFNAARAQELPVKELAHFIEINRLPWECVPSEHTTRKDVLGALFESMPMMATVRQLSKLQAHGVLDEKLDAVCKRLTDETAIERSRIHPVALMLAAGAYEAGRGRHLTWVPSPAVVDALDDAFQIALKTAESTGKRLLVAIDSSGSMHSSRLPSGVPLFKVAAAMALTYVRTDQATVLAFDAEPSAFGTYRRHPNVRDRAGVYPLALSGRMRVTDAMRAIADLGAGGGTDCSLPFRYALQQGLEVDAFVVLTDNESWRGQMHAGQALQEYRDKKNPRAKVIWCAMTAGGSSLGLPDDQRCLGICGFDASAPKLVGDFAADRF